MRNLVIKCTAGADELERANQAFTVAAAAVAVGVRVSLWLTGDAAWFAVPGHAEAVDLPLATPLADLRDLVLSSATTHAAMTVCGQCAGRRNITPDTVLNGVRIAGAAVFVEEALDEGTQALVY